MSRRYLESRPPGLKLPRKMREWWSQFLREDHRATSGRIKSADR